MKCKIEVNMNYKAFEEQPILELKEVLRRGLANIYDAPECFIILRDSNGNDVGTLTIEE